tara:strand:+ start:63 stop:566 length:504 start_codon:yes stop_codon:yes gene_type:complete
MKTKTHTQQQEFSLNFGGFYHSEHSENIDSKEESYGYNWEDIDYKSTHLNYSKEYLNRLSDELDVNLKFISLDSPKFYNFSTDKIYCSISEEDFSTLLSVYDTKELFNYIEEHSKSRDGFSSFCSGYAAVKEDKEIFLQYLFDYILQYEEIEFYDLEYEIQLTNKNL